jgi:hypothetical protein
MHLLITGLAHATSDIVLELAKQMPACRVPIDHAGGVLFEMEEVESVGQDTVIVLFHGSVLEKMPDSERNKKPRTIRRGWGSRSCLFSASDDRPPQSDGRRGRDGGKHLSHG